MMLGADTVVASLRSAGKIEPNYFGLGDSMRIDHILADH